jgi:succinate-semialdehyde dehydrogenase / glutarate-semialdehyde dehydrogenase
MHQISAECLNRIRRAQPTAEKTFAVHSPIDGSVITTVSDCGTTEGVEAVNRAAEAFTSWKNSTAYERAAVLRKWLDLIRGHEAEIARLMTLEMGKPITEAVGEVRYAATFVEWYAEEAKRAYGETVSSQFPHKRITVIRQPAGVVFGITPWNFPCAMVTRKVAAALAAGCTFILKPAEQTPLSPLFLADLWKEAGGPEATFIVLPALDPVPVSQPLLKDSRVRILTFTGSTAVGMRLYHACAATMKRVALELGGHAPFLIFEDADLDAAVREVVACKFRNAGQTCVCTNRIYVHRGIADEIIERLKSAIGCLRVGDPMDTATQIGPLVDAQGLEKVKRHVGDAIEKGGKVATGGRNLDGLFFEPTLLTAVTPEMLVMREETFGPVAPLLTFRDDGEAIRAANASPFGLAGYLWTRDLRRAYRVAEALECGIVGINDGLPAAAQMPFGGTKSSGIGREGGRSGIEEFLETKSISISLM